MTVAYLQFREFCKKFAKDFDRYLSKEEEEVLTQELETLMRKMTVEEQQKIAELIKLRKDVKEWA